MAGSSSRIDIVRNYCKQVPNASHASVARKLMVEYPGMWATENAATIAVKRARGKQGKTNRAKMRDDAYEDFPRKQMAPCPPSLSKPWEPFFLDTPNKFLILSDIHVPYHSQLAVKAAVSYGLEQGCKSLLINGDLADWYTISRHSKDPRKPRLSEELRVIGEFLDWILPQFPGQKVYKAGNHEERWDAFIFANAPMFADVEFMRMNEVLKLKERGCEWVCDQRIIMAGKLPILHGHELPKGISSPVNAARGAFMRTLHTLMIGHLHRPSTHTEPDMMGSETTCWSTGHLADPYPEYGRINKWAWGFATCEVYEDMDFQVHNYRINKDAKVRTV